MPGDFNEVVGGINQTGFSYFINRIGNRTLPPTKPLAKKYYYTRGYKGCFETNLVNGVRRAIVASSNPAYYSEAQSDPTATSYRSYAKAFDSFVRQISSDSGNSSMGVTIAESRSSLAMIAGRATQLTSAVNAIRKGSFSDLMTSLNLQRDDRRGRRVWARQSRKRAASNASSLLLEYTFGWVPMVNDVRAAMKVLSSTPEAQHVVGRGRDEWVVSARNRTDYPGGYVNTTETFRTIKHRVEIDGVVYISNPNLDLANRMGLANPIQLAWQVIPYSFLVDQFFGVSQFLGRWSAMYGRSVSNLSVSGKITTEGRYVVRQTVGNNLDYGYVYTGSGFAFVRSPKASLPIPSVPPYFRLPVNDLLGRAVTSVALLLQRLR